MSKVDMETCTCEYKWDQRKESGWNKCISWEGGWRTSFNKYMLDFKAETRTNVDKKMVRQIRIIWTEAPQEVQQLCLALDAFWLCVEAAEAALRSESEHDRTAAAHMVSDQMAECTSC